MWHGEEGTQSILLSWTDATAFNQAKMLAGCVTLEWLKEQITAKQVRQQIYSTPATPR